jgi:large subunit ribosomal protein L9
MKVILTMDVPEIGSRGEQIDVARGYARNYLIPRQLAIPATGGNLRSLREEEKLSDVRERKARREAEKIGDFLSSHEVFTTLKIGREGKAFGSVTAKDLAILLRQEGLEVDRRRIRLDGSIRRLGVFEVPVHVHADVPTQMKVFVDREGGSKDGAREAQAAWEAAEKAREEAERAEAEARAEREREAEEAARLAIERAEARRKREEEEAKAREEARNAPAAIEDEEAGSEGEASGGGPEEGAEAGAEDKTA